ncbi:MAG: ESPR domain-containing protein, partial [Oxalobacter sp.]|nr:ESPR domain-containing protein [Oxalobacter sp.]
MNRIYKTVWNKARHCYVTVSELAKSQTKGCGTRSLLVAAVVLSGLGISAPVSATNYYGIADGEHWVLEVSADGTVVKGSDNATTREQVAEGTQVATGDYLMGNWRSWQSAEDVTDGRVTFNGGEVKRIWGGFSGYVSESNASGSGNSGTGVVSGNQVTFNAGKSQYIYGGASNRGIVSGNSVELNGGEIKQAVFGGVSDWKDATGNQVTVKDATITEGTQHYVYNGSIFGVYGGYSANDSADENQVTIKGGQFNAPVYGGYTGGDNTSHANGNTVEMTGGEAVDSYIDSGLSGGPVGSIYGGYAQGGSADGNKVTISGNAVTGEVTGGYAAYKGQSSVRTADGNQVTVSGSAKVNGDILGGYTSGLLAGSHANNNIVTVSGNASAGNNADSVSIRGGVSGNSDAGKNQIIIQTENAGETVSVSANRFLEITAGEAGRPESGDHRGAATENTISIAGDVFVGVTGESGYSASIIAGRSDSGDAKDNQITVGINKGDGLGIGKVNDPSSGTPYTMVAGKGRGEVSGNAIEITKGKVYVDDMIAGYSHSQYGATGDVENNHVVISGTDTEVKVNTIYGGRSERDTGHALTDLLVQNNSVTITDSTVDGGVHGGRAVSHAVQNNTVTITGAKLTNANLAYGGSFLMSGGGIIGGFTKYGDAAENTVNISNTTIGGDAALIGGAYSEGDSETVTVVTHNTVTLDKVTSTGTLAVVGAASSEGAVGGDMADMGNQVSITDSTVASVIGGLSKNGDAKNNMVTIVGGTVTGEPITIGSSIVVPGAVYGGKSNNAAATANTVKISGAASVDATVIGGSAMNATDNTVEISGTGTFVGKDVFGGYSQSGGATGNAVTVQANAKATNITGGYSDGSGTVAGNTVTISGGTAVKVRGGQSRSGVVNGNTVEVSGGTV